MIKPIIDLLLILWADTPSHKPTCHKRSRPSELRHLLILLPLLLFIGLAIAFAVGLTRDPSVVPTALLDKPVPEFTLAGLPDSDKGLHTADMKGEVSLLSVFASWCGPCLVEHPLLMRLAHEEGISIRAITYKDKPEASAAWLARQGNPFKAVGVDPDSRVALDLGVYGVPETFVIDREGRIRFKHVGPLTPEVVNNTILPLVRELQK